MAEYIDREKLRDALSEWQTMLIETYGENDEYVRCIDSVLLGIENAPAVDVSTVVRCKDCRHRDPEDHKCDSGWPERQGCPFKVADDYFCAYGER